MREGTTDATDDQTRTMAKMLEAAERDRLDAGTSPDHAGR
jgi:hypothetical protein